ncbi:MAG: Rpp14/Pop5 family protein [Candidatus Bathyarchaeia archaeon]
MRVRHRYILVKIDAKKVPCKRDFESSLWHNIIRLFGEYGASQTDLSLIKYDQEMGHAVIRCSHMALPKVRAAIAAITKISDEEVTAHTLLVSGTLKALKRKMDNVPEDKK